VAALLESCGYQFFQVRQADGREVNLSRMSDLQAPKSGPNVFATTDPARVQARGVRIS